MSSIYNLEPQPTASAIVHTTLGEISVELFAKQAPLTCRNFLQLALDGYYDGTIFHRLIPGFILQGGDPTGTGNGGESIYDGGAFGGDLDPWPMDMRQGKNAGPQGVNFKDEFHSRLKFNRRGLLGMANDGRVDTNGSQFFFTLGPAEELNGKNTLFGRVAGDTIYNLAKIGESEVQEGTDRPLYPIKVTRVEVLVNPFEDLQKRSRVAPQIPKPASSEKEKKKKKRKGGKQLLSFGDEEGEEDVPLPKKAKFDTRIIADEGPQEGTQEESGDKPKPKAKERRESPKRPPPLQTDEEDHEEQPPKQAQKAPSSRHTRREQSHYSPSPPRDSKPEKSALEKANEEIAALKASMRRNIHTEEPVREKKKSALESMVPENSVRGGRKRRPGGSAAEDPKTVRMLKAFQSKLSHAPAEKLADPAPHRIDGAESTAQANPDDEAELCDLHFIVNCQSCTSWDKQDTVESDDEGWMSHSLSFAADKLGKDLSNRKKAEEELVVIDPREKARNLKEGQRAEREARAGQSGRQWDQRRDQARNAKLAQATSLAGRGAR